MSTIERVTRENNRLFLIELAVILLLFVADVYGYVPFSKTPFLFALAWISLRTRGFRWRDVGFDAPTSWGAAIGIGVVAGIAMSALELFVTQPLLTATLKQPPDLSEFAGIAGDPAAFAVVLAIVWILAAVGEELVYRGYLMTRFARLLNGTPTAWALSLVVVSALFGFSHFGQGITGVLENVIAGLLLGGLYLATGRNLVAPILAHGVANTVDLTLIFLGKYPGM
ncbi:MAG: CPBP family intramembrane glutamic endopeptidase [Gemmatimonadaceae bacterium]